MSIFSKLSSLSSQEKKRNKKYHIGFLAIGTRESGKAKKGCLNGQKKKSFSSSLQYFESHRQSKFWQQYCCVYGTALGAILKHDSCGLRGLPSELVAHVGEWIYGHSRCPKLDNKFPWRIYWYDSQQDIYCCCWGNKFSQFSRGTVAAIAFSLPIEQRVWWFNDYGF